MQATKHRYMSGTAGLFALLHAGVAAAFFVPFETRFLGWLAAAYLLRMFGVTAGYHRYFSHRSYKMGRAAQFLMALLAQSSGQKGVLWWAAHHRVHHRNSDAPDDIHSPKQSGLWWSHVGWILSSRYDHYEPRLVTDLARYPELSRLDRYHWVPPAALGAAVYAVGGFGTFVWGFVLSTVLLYHGTFTINSLAHLWGSRRFQTPDTSRNNFLLALITLGEGWHNNHHYYMSSCRQGIRWWEIDPTLYMIRLLSLLKITRDLRPFRVADLGLAQK